MSTQDAVTPGAKAAPEAVRLALACWLWLLGVVAAGALAWVSGALASSVAAAAALAIAPALTGFILLPKLGRRRAQLGFLCVWVLTATGLAAGTGGAASPLAAAFLIAPAMALALGGGAVRAAGAAALLGYVAAAWFARFAPPAAELGALPQLLSLASLAFAAGLMATVRSGGGREQAMGQRIAEVSHELRTPLTHILGFSEMIERQIFGEVAQRYVEYAGLIRKSGTHLLSLVNDLLDLSKIDAGRYELVLEDFDVRTVVEDVVRVSVDGAEKKQIALGLVTPEAPLLVRADERAIRRMLINTVGNAIKFTPESGRVMLIAAVSEGVLVLDTVDNGPGIPASDRDKLGEAYERGSGGARAEGTGLGLSLVRALAGLHGGALSFHEAPGGGALVRITLPVLAN